MLGTRKTTICRGKRGRADEAVHHIGKLYRIEREHKEASIEVRHLARQSASVPVLDELHAWMLKTAPLVMPKSALGTALAYMGNLWPQLTRYTERGDLPIDNNRCENAIRPFVIGRKAWLFSDTPAGARASAVIYSLVQTAMGWSLIRGCVGYCVSCQAPKASMRLKLCCLGICV